MAALFNHRWVAAAAAAMFAQATNFREIGERRRSKSWALAQRSSELDECGAFATTAHSQRRIRGDIGEFLCSDL
jgi:hypothetical protein